MDINKWFSENTYPIKDKTIAITGATGGLGREICKHLAYLGADLIFVDRNREKSEKFGNELTAEFPNISITYITADMEDIESVKEASEKLNNSNIDIFIANAGAYRIPRKKCSTGFDNIFQINYMSPYYIITKILPILKSKKGKIIAVGSIAHKFTKINKNDIELLNCKNAEKVYGNAKRIFMFSLYELFQNEREASLSIVHPGITYTNLMANYPKWLSVIIKYPMKIIFMSPKEASLSVIKGIFYKCNSYEWIGPRVFGIWGKPKISKLKRADNKETTILKNINEGIL